MWYRRINFTLVLLLVLDGGLNNIAKVKSVVEQFANMTSAACVIQPDFKETF